MMPLKKRRRVQVIVLAGAALVLATGLVGYGMRDGIAFFRSPSEVAEAPPSPAELFRIGGLVVEGSVERSAGERVAFRVTDGGATIPVTYTGPLPDLFAEGQGMIGQGRLVGGTFEAVEILAKHDENYVPREVQGALEAQGARLGVHPSSTPPDGAAAGD